MNEHDMISNISYIMHLYPETTEEILIKHGADQSKEYWTDGCDVASAYDELLQWLNSRYDRNDQETELDYHIQEILGWHDVNESVESELEIPAPYNQYYELSPDDVNYDELPDAFDNYRDLKVVAELYAKEEYWDALANNCLDCCWLVEDEVGKLLLVTSAGLRVYPITLEEIQDCVGDDSYDDWDEDDLEESVEMFGRAKRKNNSTVMHESVESTINDYKRSRDIDIDTTLGCNRSIRVGNSRAPVDTIYIQFQSRFDKYPSLVGYAHLDNGGYDHEYLSATDIRNYDLSRYMNGTDITDLEGMLRDNPSILFESTALDLSEAHEYDDYEDFEESVEMSDAQRLALQELDSALDCGEVTQEERDAGQNIQWDINFEDVVLFINGIDIDLKDIKHVAYGDCDESKFDGCYSVTLYNGEVKRYGWHDFDMTGALTPIDQNEGILSDITGMNPGGTLTEGDDGWEKPFNWTERYVKDGFVITGNHGYPKITSWHLEQTRPRTKHLGNYNTLEAAKAAGDAEIAARNKRNKNKPLQFCVHSFTSDSVIFRGTEQECADYINDNGLWSEAEIVTLNANDRHYLQEGTGSDTAHVIRDVLTTASKEDKDGWAKTIADIIDAVPDQYIDDLYDTAKDKLNSIKVDKTSRRKIVDAAKQDVSAPESADTVGKVLALFDVTSWDAKTLKTYITVVLGIVAVIEPTPIVEIITAIVAILPENVVKTILSIINMIGNPVGAVGTIANRAYQKRKNESYGDRFNPGDYVYVSVANRRGRVIKMVGSDVVEVELDGNGLYPSRIDRYYTDGVELVFKDPNDSTPTPHLENLNNTYGNHMNESFSSPVEFRYKYISDDYSDYEDIMSEEEYDAACSSENFPDNMWKRSSAVITKEDGWYQVSYHGLDNYREFADFDSCIELVNDNDWYVAIEWIDEPEDTFPDDDDDDDEYDDDYDDYDDDEYDDDF